MGKFTINIKTGPSVELTKELSDFVEQKVTMLEKYLGDAKGPFICEVELKKTTERQQTGKIYYAEFNLSYGGNLERITVEAATLYKAIEKAKDEMKRILRRSRGKERSLLRDGARKLKSLFRR